MFRKTIRTPEEIERMVAQFLEERTMASFADMNKQATTQAPAAQSMSLKWGGGGEGGAYVEKPEEKQKWALLVNSLDAREGAEVDLRVRWKKLKTPVDVYGWDDVQKKRVKKYPNEKGTQGAGLSFEVTEPGLEGLFFYRDGAASLFPTTPLAKVVNACAGRRFAEDEEVNPYEYVGRELILTVMLGKAVQPRDDGSHTNKGGHYWNIRGFRQLPVKLSFGQQAAQAPEAQPVAAPPQAATPAQNNDIDSFDDVPF